MGLSASVVLLHTYFCWDYTSMNCSFLILQLGKHYDLHLDENLNEIGHAMACPCDVVVFR